MTDLVTLPPQPAGVRWPTENWPVGDLPPGVANLQSLNVEYYSQALQSHIEEIEELLDAALRITGCIAQHF